MKRKFCVTLEGLDFVFITVILNEPQIKQCVYMITML